VLVLPPPTPHFLYLSSNPIYFRSP
jgi:hypothetical protein